MWAVALSAERLAAEIQTTAGRASYPQPAFSSRLDPLESGSAVRIGCPTSGEICSISRDSTARQSARRPREDAGRLPDLALLVCGGIESPSPPGPGHLNR